MADGGNLEEVADVKRMSAFFHLQLHLGDNHKSSPRRLKIATTWFQYVLL